jgi:glycosyltransferase involved in cell wall biosynthesis
MRILYLSPCAQLGGAERSLLDCLASLRHTEPDWELHLIAGQHGPLLAEARELGVNVHCLPFPETLAKLGCFGTGLTSVARQSLGAFPELVHYRYALRKAIRGIAPDLIHTNGFKMHLLAAWDKSAPVVWHVHDYLSRSLPMARAMQFSATRVRAVLANSQSVAEDAARVLGKDTPVQTLLNAVDLNRFQPRGFRLDLDQIAGLPAAAPGTVRVGLVGTLAKWKGHEIFLNALARRELRNAPLRAYIIGGPIYRTGNSQRSLDELRAMARDLGVEQQVGFTGFVSNTPAAIRALDIVVHASTEPEPFGLVIAEAMACARAVIASNQGGAAELVSNERDGIGIAPGDPQTLAEAIRELVRDPVKRMCLASAARTTAEARFDRARLGPALSTFYKKAIYGGDPAVCESSTSIAEIGTAA